MNIVKAPAYKTVVLDKFLGLFTGSSPESLPEGASPLAINDDFVVGGVLPRPGTRNAYSFKVSGFAGSAVDLAGGAGPWNNPFSITGPPIGLYATRALNHGQGSDTLLTTNYGLGVNPTSVIDSLTVNVTGGISGFGFPALDLTAVLMYQGSPIAEIFPVVPMFPDAGTDQVFSFSITNATLAGFLTPAVVNDPSFGIEFGVAYVGSVGPQRTVRLSGSQIQITIQSEPGLTFNYIKTFEQTDGDVITLALDSAGTIWEEDVTNNPGVLNAVYTGVIPSTQASVSAYPQSAIDSGFGGFPASNLWSNVAALIGPPDGTYATNDCSGSTGSTSVLVLTGYGLAIPPGAVIDGLTVNLNGHFDFLQGKTGGPDLTVSLYSGGNVIGTSKQVQFFSPTDAVVTFGSISDTWGVPNLTAAMLSANGFGVAVQCVLQPGAGKFGLAIRGQFEIESVQLQATYTLAIPFRIEGNTFAQSSTLDDREFIAFSNLLNGTDIPRTFDGTHFNRLSQVGPGAPPSASTTTTGSAILSVTQNPAVPLLVGSHDWLLVSDSPSDHGSFGTPATPGNVMTIIFRSATLVPSYLKPGMNIILTGFPAINGNRVNNDPAGVLAPKFYTVNFVGQPIPGQQSYNAIVFTVNFTTFYNAQTPAGCAFEATEATMTTAGQIPNLEVGGQFAITGTGGAPPTGYDSSWLVDATPNASQLQIVSTVLVGNVATYGFNLITGTPPVVGQAVTVSNTLNGNGFFNVANAIISSVTAGTFSIGIQSPTSIPSAAEDGDGLIFGTIFQFDAFAIVGNKFGGTIVSTGIIAAGKRKVCYSFLTRDGYLTQPSPIFEYDVVAGANALAISDLLPGPDNVIARVIHLTGANGDNFYNIPVPVTVISNGQKVVNSSTYLNDNLSTNITLSFSDDVLTAATSIDTPGNNLFETSELGSPIALVPYADRMVAIGEQNKIQNLLNYSFDGGIQVNKGNAGAGGGPGTTQTFPAGWTPDPIFGGGGSVGLSPIFGFAYDITIPPPNTVGPGGSTFDKFSSNAGSGLSASVGGTPSQAGELAILIEANGVNSNNPGAPVPAGWTAFTPPNGGTHSSFYSQFLTSAAAITATQTLLGSADTWAELLLFFGSSTRAVISLVQAAVTFISGNFSAGNHSTTFGSPTSAGSGILVILSTVITTTPIAPTMTDTHGNVYTVIGSVINAGGASIVALWSPNVPVGHPTMTFNLGSGNVSGAATAYEISGIGPLAVPGGPVGMITQPAFQDEFEVPIIVPSTTYSVRVTASGFNVGGDLSGNIVVDIYSPSANRVLGAFSLPLSSLSSTMGIFSGTLLTAELAPVPSDLLIRLYVTGALGNWQIAFDRIEPFPTEQPNLSGQVILSYQGNFEAFDREDGVVNASVQNQQPVKSSFTLFDTLYMVKSGSLVSTQDNKTTQPSQWGTPRVVSNVVGTTSIYGVAGVSDQDSGEEWAVIAGQPGAFIFNGGQPVKCNQEIQELWNLINWKYGHTLWTKIDITNQRILIGVPLATPNQWLPAGIVPDNPNPTVPNVILALNYKFLNTAGAVSERAEVHVSSFGGKLLSVDMSRKWSIWTIPAPCAAFVKRQDNSVPLMLGNSAATGKIYQLVPGLLEDDGQPFNQIWVSHGFPTSEQEQGLQLGSVRKGFEFMTMVLGGSGSLKMTAMPDAVDSPYSHDLLPNLNLPATVSGDVEVPLNELGNRLFMKFSTNAVGAGFNLSRIVMAMREDPWSPVRGRNA